MSETCEEGNAVQMITHVEVTPSSGGDAGVTVGVVDRLRELGSVLRSCGATRRMDPDTTDGRQSVGGRSW